MGWLKELMRLAEPPVGGYGELARTTLAHPEWPEDTRPQVRSLGALYSKLDRGLELEWLADREAVQRVLALVLGCPLELVRRPLQHLHESPDSGRLRFEDLPFARPFDPTEELLPPGIPEEVLRPSGWQHLWWRAPSGSGRSLTGRWLAARGLAVCICARSWKEAAHRVPSSGPCFVELERGNDLDALCEAHLRAGLCVAAPEPPPAGAPGAESWSVIESPRPAEYLGALLRWLEARVPQDGSFDAAAAHRWLAEPVARGHLPTLGAVLGVAGLLDAQGIQQCRGKGLEELAAQFVNERLEKASGKGSAEAQWLKRFGFEVLVRLAEEVLTRGDRPWAVARSHDEWIELIPDEFRHSVDAEWMKWSLSRSGRQGTLGDLERALRNLPPGAYRIVRALVDAGLLRGRGAAHGLVISPEFLEHAAERRARERLVHEGSAFSWGEALLRPHAAPGVLEALHARVAQGDFAFVEGLLELDLRSQPALIAAAEAVFVCIGISVLGGAEVPPELLVAIWNEQLGWVLELPGEMPRPRLLCCSGSSPSPLADPAVWALSALAISELLAEHTGAAHPLLRPWGGPRASPQLAQLLESIHAALLRPDLAHRDWAVEAFALAGRLYAGDDTAGLADPSPVATPALARPALAVRALVREELDGSWLETLGPHPLEVRALRAECELRHVPWPRMAQALWRAWYARGGPPNGAALLGPDSPCRDQLWPHMPPEALDAAWSRWADRCWPLECFGERQWSTWVERWLSQFPRHGTSPLWARALECMDERWVQRTVSAAELWSSPAAASVPLFAVVWRRFPELLLRAVAERITHNDANGLRTLLAAAPARADADVVTALAAALSERSVRRPILDEARRWLSTRVAARGQGWQRAYMLFADLEDRVARSLRARGGAAV